MFFFSFSMYLFLVLSYSFVCWKYAVQQYFQCTSLKAKGKSLYQFTSVIPNAKKRVKKDYDASLELKPSFCLDIELEN